jgi:hypothetical protein
MKEMTGRERVGMALQRKEPDRALLAGWQGIGLWPTASGEGQGDDPHGEATALATTRSASFPNGVTADLVLCYNGRGFRGEVSESGRTIFLRKGWDERCPKRRRSKIFSR